MTHHASTERQHLEITIEVDVGEHLENHVHAAASRQRHDPAHVVGVAVIEHLVRALLAHQRDALVSPGGPNHAQPCARAICVAQCRRRRSRHG